MPTRARFATPNKSAHMELSRLANLVRGVEERTRNCNEVNLVQHVMVPSQKEIYRPQQAKGRNSRTRRVRPGLVHGVCFHPRNLD